MIDTIAETVLAQTPITANFEGDEPYMYRDNSPHGWVTVGIGTMLPNVAAAQALPFYRQDFVTLATADQIAKCYSEVSGMAGGKQDPHSAAYYYFDATLVLKQGDTRNLLSSKLTSYAQTVRAGFAAWDALPLPARQAVLDMAYNLGPHGLLDGYPRMLAALATTPADWVTAAAQCLRVGDGLASRNAWTVSQMKLAGGLL